MSTKRSIALTLPITSGLGYKGVRLVGLPQLRDVRSIYRSVKVTSLELQAVQVSLLGDDVQSYGTIRFGIIPQSSFNVGNVDAFNKGRPDLIPYLEILPLSETSQSKAVYSKMPVGVEWEIAYEQPEKIDPVVILINDGFVHKDGICLAKLYCSLTVECTGETFGI